MTDSIASNIQQQLETLRIRREPYAANIAESFREQMAKKHSPFNATERDAIKQALAEYGKAPPTGISPTPAIPWS
ncbi:hypothetical protein KZO85_12720 [Chromohalobacter canadensis]|uniref:hypothetical protein n=1 Tax=Chromohalobacter canadensis TaxID=141389 RepID=UPI0021C10B23|nr:hypothetical protein [Chromohalobacter canadensis]MCT8469449.1 hypothetical protein [Chromohalobacter canadensis]MCT8472073.1 hypothetical protein [Chromohalobacter canadensis]MCT8499814.1 hypothetical protein [Chromohalobacter canadensis]